jgi:hypothetical protein
MDTFVKAGERGLKARAKDAQAAHEAEVRELRAKIGELVHVAVRPLEPEHVTIADCPAAASSSIRRRRAWPANSFRPAAMTRYG